MGNCAILDKNTCATKLNKIYAYTVFAIVTSRPWWPSQVVYILIGCWLNSLRNQCHRCLLRLSETRQSELAAVSPSLPIHMCIGPSCVLFCCCTLSLFAPRAVFGWSVTPTRCCPVMCYSAPRKEMKSLLLDFSHGQIPCICIIIYEVSLICVHKILVLGLSNIWSQ